MRAVDSAMERAVGECSLKLESQMILLASAVSGAPFLGLLGTVWGVMDTFGDVAAAGSANLTAMAPGVSAALITTVTGLLVAIPAMFGYNFLVTSIRAMTVDMDNFAAELSSEMAHRYVDHGSRPLPEIDPMRRYSQKHSFSTLSEINVTPLLDLAFVLLIIFIITTPLMDKSTGLILPSSKAAADAVNPSDEQTVTIDKDAVVALNTQPVSLDQLTSLLSAKYSAQPATAVVVRSHRDLTVQKLVDVLDAIRRAGITKVGVVANPPGQ